MDIDDELYGNNTTSNGFANHGTVSNGHALLTDNSNGGEKVDPMECELNHLESDDELLVRILQFGKELHALKQQLHHEYGENAQNDKMLQVGIRSSLGGESEIGFF